MRIVVLDGYTLNPGDNPWDEVTELGDLTVYDRTEPGEILERSRDAEILLTNKTPLTGETLGHLDRLRYIGVLATGYNVVDLDAARGRNIPVSNVPVYGTDSVAQFVFALLFSLCLHVDRHDRAIKQGRWASAEDFCFWDAPLMEVAGKTMGIVGFGRIGRRVGELAHAFRMNVLAANPSRVNPTGYAFTESSIPDLFTQSDVITLHCPLTESNAGMVNRELLELMKPTAFLINTARGGLINELDLSHALNEGRIAGAACDVVSVEPIEADNPLLSSRNIVLTPHIAWATLEARRRLMHITAKNIRAFQAGQPINVVNQPPRH